MGFDQADYRKRVLQAYRGSKQRHLSAALRELKSDPKLRVPVGIDLTDLYDMPRGASDPQIAAQVVAVGKAFGNVAGNARMAAIGPALTSLHAMLTERNPDLGTAAFWEARFRNKEAARLEQLRDLLPAVQAATHGLGLISHDRIADVVAQGGHDPSAAEGLKALAAEAGLLVVPPAPKPHGTVTAAYANAFAKSGCASVIDLIFLERPPTAFRIVDGFAAEPALAMSVAQAQASFRLTEQRPSNDDFNMAQGQALQVMLREVQSDAELAAFAYAALVDQAKQALRGAPPVAVARELAATRLDRTDARRIVLSLAGTSSMVTFDNVIALLAEGKVREARGLFARLDTDGGASTGESRARAESALSQREHTLAELREQARAALDAGDVETSRKALDQALSLCTDDDELDAMLRGLPPAPPHNLAAAASEEGHVHLSWTAGFGSGEQTRYRIVRKLGSAPANAHDGVPIGEPQAATEARDENPPIGVDVYYGVAARHTAGLSSVATVATRVIPPVSNVHVVSEPTRLTVRWDSHPATARVDVIQVDATGVTTTLTPNRHGSVTAEGLTRGASYTFALTARYVTEASEVAAEVVRVTGIPRGQARPVPVLTVRRVDDAANHILIDVTWKAIDGFDVEVWHFDRAPDWDYGTRVPYATIAAAGARLAGRDISTAQHQGVRGSVTAGLRHYVAVTRDGSEGIVGACEPMGVCPPLRDVDAQRFQELAVLSWQWPGPEFDVIARWSGPAGHGERRLTQAAYRDEGGLRIPCGGGDLKVVLTTATPVGTPDWRSPKRVVEVKGAPPTVQYKLDWVKGLLGKPRAVTVTFSGAQALTLPVTVVARGGDVMPFEPSSGAVSLYEGTVDIRPELPTVLPTLTLPPLGRHFWVRAFSAAPHARLIDPPVENLRGA